MIEWLKNWTNGMIVAVIIAVIFELIIPNGNNKKYIKTIINLYVLFVILNPLISKFTNLDEIEISDTDYKKYISSENSISTSSSLNSNKLINSTAQNTIKDNIRKKLKTEGYNVTSISINIDNENGQINSIKLFVEKVDSGAGGYVSASNNYTINIDKIQEVNVTEKKEGHKENIKKSEIQNIKKLLAKEYEISEDNIEVN